MRKLFIGSLVSALTLLCLAVSGTVMAQQAPLDPVCQGAGTASNVCSKDNNTTLTGSNGVIVKVARLLAYGTGAASVIMIMIGGVKYIISTGDPTQINGAKNTILYALIGLVVSVFAPFVIGYALSFLK